MSTRANVVVKDEYGHLIFYRHSDGYPGGTLPSLNQFLDLVKSGKIRDNLAQSAGWLILIGADEYGADLSSLVSSRAYDGWKVGAYEPTDSIHGDIEYLYEIDLTTKEISVHKCGTIEFDEAVRTLEKVK